LHFGALQQLFPQPLLQPELQQVCWWQQVGLQHFTFLHLGALHFGALQQLFPQPLLQPLSQQDLGAQQLFAAGAQQLGAAAGAQQLGAAAAGAQQLGAAAAGAQQLGAALQQAGAGAQQLAGAQQVGLQQLRRNPKAFASEPAARIKAAAVNVIHFMSVFS